MASRAAMSASFPVKVPKSSTSNHEHEMLVWTSTSTSFLSVTNPVTVFTHAFTPVSHLNDFMYYVTLLSYLVVRRRMSTRDGVEGTFLSVRENEQRAGVGGSKESLHGCCYKFGTFRGRRRVSVSEPYMHHVASRQMAMSALSCDYKISNSISHSSRSRTCLVDYLVFFINSLQLVFLNQAVAFLGYCESELHRWPHSHTLAAEVPSLRTHSTSSLSNKTGFSTWRSSYRKDALLKYSRGRCTR